MSYRDNLEALTRRVEALTRDAGRTQANLDEARRLLAEAQARRRLPVLDNLHVAAPCSADWSAMTGDERVRHCGSCDKDVYNLSSMTRLEAETLLIEREGKLCVRYYQRADGTVLTSDCPVGVRRRRRRRKVAVAAFGAMSALAAAGTASMTMGAARRPVTLVRQSVLEVKPDVPDPVKTVEAPPVVRMGEAPVLPRPPLMGKSAFHAVMGAPPPVTMGSISRPVPQPTPKAHKKPRTR